MHLMHSCIKKSCFLEKKGKRFKAQHSKVHIKFQTIFHSHYFASFHFRQKLLSIFQCFEIMNHLSLCVRKKMNKWLHPCFFLCWISFDLIFDWGSGGNILCMETWSQHSLECKNQRKLYQLFQFSLNRKNEHMEKENHHYPTVESIQL